MVYMLTFTINIPQMLAYIPYMDPMGILTSSVNPLPPPFQEVSQHRGLLSLTFGGRGDLVLFGW